LFPLFVRLRTLLDVIAQQKQFRPHDACDVLKECVRRAIVDWDRNRSVQQASPERDDPLWPVLAPEDNVVAFADAGRLQAGGKSARGPRSFCVRVSACAVPVVVHEECPAVTGDIAEEIE
jgi:hypothetical protein